MLGYAELATLCEPASIAPTVRSDPDDDHVLACALAAAADTIVSGDVHLLNLAHYHGIAILNPAAAINIVSGSYGRSCQWEGFWSSVHGRSIG